MTTAETAEEAEVVKAAVNTRSACALCWLQVKQGTDQLFTLGGRGGASAVASTDGQRPWGKGRSYGSPGVLYLIVGLGSELDGEGRSYGSASMLYLIVFRIRVRD